MGVEFHGRGWMRSVGMIKRAAGLVLLLAAVAVGQSSPTSRPVKRHDPKVWEKDIKKFEAADAKAMPAPGSVEFVGSSTIRIWDLKSAFPGLDAFNRGFGGSWSVDCDYYADRIVVKYRPRLVVYYAGDNDIGGGASAASVDRAFEDFVAKVKAGVPGVKIVYLCIKPSIARWNKWPAMRQANAMVKAFAEKTDGVSVVDCSAEMLGEDGRPRKELYRPDGLHMSAAGYEIWNLKLRPVVEQRSGDGNTSR